MSDRDEFYRRFSKSYDKLYLSEKQDDLVERVAQAICETENGPCECLPDECGCTYWRAHARTAIAVALEEAARVALEKIAVGDVPRVVGQQYRSDGQPSKNDRCEHDVWMYAECGDCLELFARAALAQVGDA